MTYHFKTCAMFFITQYYHKSSKEFEMTSKLVFFFPRFVLSNFIFTSNELTSFFFFFSLTQLLEDVQKVLSVKIDEDSTETLEIISEDFKTLRKIWNKVRQRPAQETLSGKNFFSFFWSFPEIFWNYLDFCS